MDVWLIWALVLFAAGLLITAVEVILPSGGLLAIAAFACLVGSLACAYQLGGWWALGLAAIEGVCVPVVIVFMFKVLPRTSVGRQLMLSPPENPRTGGGAPTAGPAPSVAQFGDMMGREGVTLTGLRPSGTAEFDGRRTSVVSDGQHVGPGRRVRVTLVEGNRIVVEPVEAGDDQRAADR